MARRSKKPVVGISLGDPSGIGPEITARSLASSSLRRMLTPVVFGDAAHRKLFDANVQFVAVSSLPAAHRQPGKSTTLGARASLRYIDELISWGKKGAVDAMCTAPVSKENISRANVAFMGHTERLAEAFEAETLMLMHGPKLTVALATNHVPISKLAQTLEKTKLFRQLQLLSKGLEGHLRRKPRIAVCGLNPHAGEGGLLGSEEVNVIAPAVAKARRAGMEVQGPFPADGLFSQWRTFEHDVVLAMFHDQALCVTKALDFRHTVNVTLGLPLPRTSPDHGVAYDLAGKNQADPVPMREALKLAATWQKA